MKHLFFLTSFILSSFLLLAQEPNENVKYLDAFNNEFTKIQEVQLDYTSYLVHGRGEVADQKRQVLRQAVTEAVSKVEAIPANANDKGLKKAALESFKAIEEMTNKDYDAIIRQKAGCENCFAAVKIEYEVTEAAAAEANKALSKMHKKIGTFAKENNITFIDGDDELNRTLSKIYRINDYLQLIDLSVLQAHYASEEVVKAFNTQDIKTAEAAVKKMKKEMGEAQKRFASVNKIPEDAVCLVKAKILMDFYQKMTDEMYPDMLKAFEKKGNVSEKGANIFNKNIEKISAQLPAKNEAYTAAKAELLQKAVPPPAKKG